MTAILSKDAVLGCESSPRRRKEIFDHPARRSLQTVYGRRLDLPASRLKMMMPIQLTGPYDHFQTASSFAALVPAGAGRSSFGALARCSSTRT